MAALIKYPVDALNERQLNSGDASAPSLRISGVTLVSDHGVTPRHSTDAAKPSD
jgi:hypothetical protein